MKLIIDVTRANPDTEGSLVQRAVSAYPSVSRVDITILRVTHQMSAVTFGQEVVLPSGTHYSLVANVVFEQLRQMLNVAFDQAVVVFTFHKVVFELNARLTTDQQMRVTFRSFSSLWQHTTSYAGPQGLRSASSSAESALQAGSTMSGEPPSEDILPSLATNRPVPQRQPMTTFRWPHELMPIDDAVTFLVAALREVSATAPAKAVRQTDVRAILARLDNRFEKANPLASFPGFISALLRAAEDRDAIAIDRLDINNPRIWLSAEAAGADNRRFLQVARRSHSRSQEFLDSLRRQRLGPFSNIRRQLFDALEMVINDGPVALGELLRKTIDVTRSSIQTQGLEAGRYPWRHVREFLTELLTRRPVLVGLDGSSVAPSFVTLATPIAGIHPDWRSQLDGELTVALVAGGVDIRLADVSALAGALYFERSDHTEAEAATVISKLLEIGRIEESDDDQHRLVLPTVPPPAPVASANGGGNHLSASEGAPIPT